MPPSNQSRGARIASAWQRFPRRALAIEVAVVLGLFGVYRMGRHMIDGQVSEAMRNAQHIWRAERFLSLPNEESIQTWALSFDHVAKLANIYYLSVHFPATGLMLIWLFLQHRSFYGRIRTELAILTGLGLVIHMLYPLAPPRLVPGVEMTDTMNVVGPSAYPGGTDDGVANQFAAMPSLHIGWAVVVALAIFRVVPSPWRWLAWLHPTITTIVVVITANHYWLDGLVALALLLLSIGTVQISGRLRKRYFDNRPPEVAETVHMSEQVEAMAGGRPR